MRRILMAVMTALLVPASSHALQLGWSSGPDTLTFTGATRCTLLVRAEAAESMLPNEWRLLWNATVPGIQPLLLAPGTCGSTSVADVAEILGPATPADSAAHLFTVRFKTTGGETTVARYVIDLPAGASGKFKAIALDPADPDSATVLVSREVFFNGGVTAPFVPVVLHATHTHGSEVLSILAVGDGLEAVSSPAIITRDRVLKIPLSIRSAAQTSFIAEGVLPDALPEAELAVQANGHPLAAVPVTPDVVLGEQPTSFSSVSYLDPDPNIQPRDFAFIYNRVPTATPNVWRSLFHLIYTTLLRNQGAASQVTFRHTWTSRPDIYGSWHVPVVTLTTSSSGWDQGLIYAPSIILYGGQWRMFYTGVDVNNKESIGVVSAALLDTTNTQWGSHTQILATDASPPNGVLHPSWVATPGNGFPGTMRDPYVLEDPDQPGSLLMYYVAGNSFDQTQQSPPLFFRNAVGIVRSQGPSLTQVWSDLGYLRSTDGKHGVTGNAESPHVFPDNAHADAGGQAAGLWRLMFTDGPAYPDSSIRFEVAQGRISDTTLASWQPTPVLPTKLYDYLHQDFTVYGWEATEYLHVAPVDFLAAYDGTGIPITRMYWTGTDFVLGFPDVSAPRGGREVAALGFAVSELALGSGLVRLAIDVPVTATVTITAYDVMGRRIKRIFDRRVPSGRTLVSWDGCSDSGERVSSGIYFAQLTCEMGRRVVRIPLVR